MSTPEELKSAPSHILLEIIAGSHLYGLNHKDSDVDIRGIFIPKKEDLFRLSRIPQIQDSKGDILYWDIHRFVELAYANNPNILEVLAAETPLVRNPLMGLLPVDMFLSKLCKDSFCGYAMGQIKKARGLNKKIVNPQPKNRKDILEFCYIINGHKSMGFWEYFYKKHKTQNKNYIFEHFLSKFGLSKVENGDGLFCAFEDSNFRGILSDLESTNFRLSSIPKDISETQSMLIYYNHNGFQTHCKQYREYWDWVESRNVSRYEKNIEADKNFDTKNMMHTFRLLNVGHEIALDGTISNDRTSIDRDFLFSIRNGDVPYEDCMRMVDEKIILIERDYKRSKIQDVPDKKLIEKKLSALYSCYFKIP